MPDDSLPVTLFGDGAPLAEWMPEADPELEALAVDIEQTQAVATLRIAAGLHRARERFRYKRAKDGADGGFGGWCERRLKFTSRTAYKLISIHEAFGNDVGSSVHTLGREVLYAISAQSTPQAARDAALEAAARGETITKADALRMIEEARAEAHDAAEADMLERLTEAENKAERAVREVTEAVERGRAAATAAAEARITELETSIAEANDSLDAAKTEGREEAETEAAATITKLEALLEQERTAATNPQPVDVIAFVERALKITGLSPMQLSALAQTLNMSITVGRKTYHPVSEEVRLQRRILIEEANRVVKATSELARASPAEMLVGTMWAGDRVALARDAQAAIDWLQAFLKQHAATPMPEGPQP